MKALITGANGTVGGALCNALQNLHHEVTAWDRGKVPTDDYHAMEAFVRKEAPDAVFHLAVASRPTGKENESWHVSYEWSGELAWIARELRIPFVFTSTVMVFTDKAKGPFRLDSQPDAAEGYGFEKLQAERRIMEQNPSAYIVRLGWQIGEKPGSNNMIDFFEQKMKEEGKITASRRWLPACSFLFDTAAALRRALDLDPGLYLVDSNRRWTFAEIAHALNKEHGNRWIIEENDAFQYDQRMLDDRLEVPPLSARLTSLS